MKYWNKERIRRVKKRRAHAEERALENAKESERSRRTYTAGDMRKNAPLMLNALGSERNRTMLARLCLRGAMSVSKLTEPFPITLSAAMNHVNALERAGLITTHKRGRIRFCVYKPAALKELSLWLASRAPLGVR